MAANTLNVSRPSDNSDLIPNGLSELGSLFGSLWQRICPIFVASERLVVVLRFSIRKTPKLALWSTAGDSGSIRSSPELVWLCGECLCSCLIDLDVHGWPDLMLLPYSKSVSVLAGKPSVGPDLA